MENIEIFSPQFGSKSGHGHGRSGPADVGTSTVMIPPPVNADTGKGKSKGKGPAAGEVAKENSPSTCRKKQLHCKITLSYP